jgi:hypothetical protein
MRNVMSVLPVLLLVTGCSSADKTSPTPVPTAAAAGAHAGAAVEADSAVGGARSVKQENDLFSFEYSYPAAAGAIPALRAMLDADLNKQLGELRKSSSKARDDAKKEGFDYRAYSRIQSWKVVTDVPGWLSLSAEFYDYTGGAHGNHWFGSMLWDKQARKPRDPLEPYVSKEALSGAIRKPFCTELDRQRAAKRGKPAVPGSTDEFDACIDPVAETVILGSTNGKTFDRIGILVPPYEAGPYVEGNYEVTLPVTPALLEAVKPEFRPAFSVVK